MHVYACLLFPTIQLSSSQLDSLLSLLHPNPHLQLASGGTVTLTPSHCFVLEVPDLSCLTPSSVAQMATLCMSPATISWRDVAYQWLLKWEKQQTESLQSLFDVFIPKCVEFLAPVLEGVAHEEVGSDVSVAPSRSGVGQRLTGQELKLTEVHIIKTCCTILQVSPHATGE